MVMFSPRSYDIRRVLGRHVRREDLTQDLVPVVNPSHPSSPENINNKGNDPHDVGRNHECTREAKMVWISFRSLLIGFGKYTSCGSFPLLFIFSGEKEYLSFMVMFSPRSYDIRRVLGRHVRREDLTQDLVPVVNPSHPSSPENINNKGNDPHDVGRNHECTREAKMVWISFRSLLIGFGK